MMEEKETRTGSSCMGMIPPVGKPSSRARPFPPNTFTGGKHADCHHQEFNLPCTLPSADAYPKCLVNTIPLLQPRLCLNSITLISSWPPAVGAATEIIWAISPYGGGDIAHKNQAIWHKNFQIQTEEIQGTGGGGREQCLVGEGIQSLTHRKRKSRHPYEQKSVRNHVCLYTILFKRSQRHVFSGPVSASKRDAPQDNTYHPTNSKSRLYNKCGYHVRAMRQGWYDLSGPPIQMPRTKNTTGTRFGGSACYLSAFQLTSAVTQME